MGFLKFGGFEKSIVFSIRKAPAMAVGAKVVVIWLFMDVVLRGIAVVIGIAAVEVVNQLRG